MITLLSGSRCFRRFERCARALMGAGRGLRSVVMPLAAMDGASGFRLAGLHRLGVGPEACRSVAARSAIEGLLPGLQVLLPSMPRLQRWILEGAPIGEADLPGLGPGQPVDRVEVR